MRRGGAFPSRRSSGWHQVCFIDGYMLRYLLASSGILLFGSLGAFFMLVPILPTLTVALMLMGLVLMFEFGLQIGRRGVPQHLPRV